MSLAGFAQDIANNLGILPNPFSQAHQEKYYRINRIVTRYIWNQGTNLLPVAKPGNSANQVTPSVIVQTSSPFGYKIVTWVIERMGQFPLLPDWEPDNANQVFASSEINFGNVQPEPNGQPVFHIEGTYVYLLKQPISIKNGIFHIGMQPVIMNQGNMAINASSFANLTPTNGSENPG